MAYLSRYDITVVPDHLQNEVEEAIVRRVGYDPFKGECTWYDFISDVGMVMLDTAEPSIITMIDRRGEEEEDIERLFFNFNGHYQVHYPPAWEPPEAPVRGWEWKVP